MTASYSHIYIHCEGLNLAYETIESILTHILTVRGTQLGLWGLLSHIYPLWEGLDLAYEGFILTYIHCERDWTWPMRLLRACSHIYYKLSINCERDSTWPIDEGFILAYTNCESNSTWPMRASYSHIYISNVRGTELGLWDYWEHTHIYTNSVTVRGTQFGL